MYANNILKQRDVQNTKKYFTALLLYTLPPSYIFTLLSSVAGAIQILLIDRLID